MDRLFNALRPLIRGVVRHAAWVLAVAVLVSGAGLYYASQLTIDTDIANLVPQDRPSVQALEELRRTVGGESDVAVGIVSPSFEANKQFAEALIPRALDLTNPETGEPFLTRVEYEREVDFLKDNALYFASESELTSVEQFLDEKVEEAKLKANPFYFDLDDEESEADADSAARELEQVYDRLVGKRYPISDDSTTMVVRFYPSGTSTDIGFIDRLYDRLRETVDEMDPASYNADMEVVLSGRLYRRLVEVRTIQNDVAGSFGSGAGSVLLVVMLYFLYKAARARKGSRSTLRALLAEAKRAPVMAGVIAVPLIMSLMWTGGVAYGLYGNLNLMTSTLGLVLFGLGIDFGIHFYGRYAEERADGRSVEAAAETTFTSTGQAITIGALTTAGALYVLTVAEFKGFSEFGAIAGTGVLFALVAMTIVMTALLAVFERTRLLNLEAAPGTERVGGNGVSAGGRYPAARPLVVGSLFAVGAALILLPRVDFQYRFGELEPEYEEYEEKARVIDRYSTGESGRRNPAYIVADSAADVPEIVRAVEEKQADSASTVLAVESLQERFPLRDSSQADKLARIAEIRDRLANDKYLRNADSEQMDRLRRAAQTREPIALDQVPESLRKRFTTRDGELGTFVVIYPSVGLSDGRNSIAFKKEIGTIRTEDGEVYHAGSTSLVAAEMLLIMQEEAPWMVAGTLLLVALLMLLNFRSWRWAGLALVPLVVGLLWMLLVMELFGLMLNFYNMIVLPAVVGIGNDAGVHLVHRYREEGRGSIRDVLRSTGEHVTMGSLTTMIGFGGLLLSFHPGLRSIGVLAVIGIGATLVSALVFLPALLQWLEDRGLTPLPDTPPAENASENGSDAPVGNGAVSTEEEEAEMP